jgi:hypothetical protein
MLTKTSTIYHQNQLLQDDLQYAISGCNLAHGKRSAVERAFVGADLKRSCAALINPTIKQAACLAGVSVPYVAAAVLVADDQTLREAVLAGDVGLLEAARANAPESLVAHFMRSTPEQRLECARAIGPAAIWDSMLVPII